MWLAFSFGSEDASQQAVWNRFSAYFPFLWVWPGWFIFVAFLVFIAIISSEAVLIKSMQCVCCFTSVLALIDFKNIINGCMVCLNLTLDTQSVCYCMSFPIFSFEWAPDKNVHKRIAKKKVKSEQIDFQSYQLLRKLLRRRNTLSFWITLLDTRARWGVSVLFAVYLSSAAGFLCLGILVFRSVQ